MRKKWSKTGRLAALGGVALTLAAGCSVPGHAPRNAAPEGDVVSVGYGTQPREDVAVPISSVSPEPARRGNVSRVEDLLEGIPGVQVLPLSNGDFTVRIRGMGTGLGNAEPLLVIDDMQVPTGGLGATLATVPARDIVRIDVLKDAASAAVYGIRGANGVIIVTTRRRR